MTHWDLQTTRLIALGVICLLFAEAQTTSDTPDDFALLPLEGPRLLLRTQRLRLLRRERERQSPRWQQVEALVAGKGELAEPALALGLYSQAAKDPAPCRESAVFQAPTLRLQAIAFDWCQEHWTAAQRRQAASKLKQGGSGVTVEALRDRLFAALALSDIEPEYAQAEVRRVLRDGWLGKVVPALKAGQALAREESYALMELLHVTRDNTNADLREAVPSFFRELPLFHLLSTYPSPFPAPENDYRIPFFTGDGDPDLNAAAMSRAAELAMVSYDPNLNEHQILQSWLIQDRFMMRSPLGAPYEFLWANPYTPGITYHAAPNLFHDTRSGRLFLRSGWEEDATFFCYSQGAVQFFEEGKRRRLLLTDSSVPLEVGDVKILLAKDPLKWVLDGKEAEQWFLVGLPPRTRFDVEVDDEELAEAFTDAGGILALKFGKMGGPAGVRIRSSR